MGGDVEPVAAHGGIQGQYGAFFAFDGMDGAACGGQGQGKGAAAGVKIGDGFGGPDGGEYDPDDGVFAYFGGLKKSTGRRFHGDAAKADHRGATAGNGLDEASAGAAP